jgi:hypothetical protein
VNVLLFARVARLLGPEDLLVGLSYAPWFHREET